MSSNKQKTPVQLLPFQQENVATNQQNIPVPYLAGERLVAIRWMTPALQEKTKQADSTTKKSG